MTAVKPGEGPRSACFYDQLEVKIGYTPMHDQLRRELVTMTRGFLALLKSTHQFNAYHTACVPCQEVMAAADLSAKVSKRKIMCLDGIPRDLDSRKQAEQDGSLSTGQG